MSYVYQTMTAGDICNALLADEFARWTYDQAAALAEHLIEYAEGIGMPLEFNRVAVRCDFAAFNSLFDLASHYGKDFPDEKDVLEYFQDFTTVIECADGTVIIQEF